MLAQSDPIKSRKIDLIYPIFSTFQVDFNPLVFEEPSLPLHIASPVRNQGHYFYKRSSSFFCAGFRYVFTENAKRYVNRFSNQEPRKRSFEKQHDPEKSLSTSINMTS